MKPILLRFYKLDLHDIGDKAHEKPFIFSIYAITFVDLLIFNLIRTCVAVCMWIQIYCPVQRTGIYLVKEKKQHCRCFRTTDEKICICASGSDDMLGGHKSLYWFGRNVPTSNSLLLVLPAFGS